MRLSIRRGVAPLLVGLVGLNLLVLEPPRAEASGSGVFDPTTARLIAEKAAPYLGAGLGRDLAAWAPKLSAGGVVVAVTVPGLAGAVFVGVAGGVIAGAATYAALDWWDRTHPAPQPPEPIKAPEGNIKVMPECSPNYSTGLWTVRVPAYPRNAQGSTNYAPAGSVKVYLSVNQKYVGSDCQYGGIFSVSIDNTFTNQFSGGCAESDQSMILGGSVGTTGSVRELLGYNNVVPGTYLVKNWEKTGDWSPAIYYEGNITLPALPSKEPTPPPKPQWPDAAYQGAFAGGAADGALAGAMGGGFTGRSGPTAGGLNIVIDGTGILEVGSDGRPRSVGTGTDITGSTPGSGTGTGTGPGPGTGPAPTNPDAGPDTGGEPGTGGETGTGGGSDPKPTTGPQGSANPTTPPTPPPPPPPGIPDWQDELFFIRFMRLASTKFPFDWFTLGGLSYPDHDLYVEFFQIRHDLNWSKAVWRGVQGVTVVGLMIALFVAL